MIPLTKKEEENYNNQKLVNTEEQLIIFVT